MNKKLFVILFLSLLLTTSGSFAFAKDFDGDHDGDDKVKTEDVNELEAEDADDEFEITLSPSPTPVIGGFSFAPSVPNTKIKINKSNFEIIGKIDSISGNVIVVAGQTIVIDISKVKNFEQKGILTVGKTVNVEGVIVDGTKFAKEIKVFGASGQEVKIEIKNVPGEIKVEAKGPLDQILLFLKQLLGIT